MFAKFCTWTVAASLAFLLSACGGGDPDAATATAASDAQASVVVQSDERVASISGSSAFFSTRMITGKADEPVAGGKPRVLDDSHSNPELADDEARGRMALNEAEYEKSYSIEMNRQTAAQKERDGVVEPVVAQAYVPHQDCLDPRLPECAGNPLLAQQ